MMHITINSNVKPLLLAVFLGSVSSFATAGPEENNHHAPEATAAEAMNTHWDEPEIQSKFWDIPELEKAFMDARPADRNDGISVAKLGIDTGNKKMIMTLAQEIADKKHTEVDSMLIAHKGKLVFESYYSRGRVDLSHPQSSSTKSYTNLALGRAIQLGYLSMADLNKLVASFLKDLDPTKFVKGVDKITLHEALTMRGGLRVSDDKWKELQKNPSALKGQGLVQALFEHSAPITAEPKQFAYGNFNPVLVMQVIEAVVPGAAKDFIKKSTKRNIQLSDEQVQDFYSGSNISNSGYGYFWWQVDMKVGNKKYLSKSAQGGGGVTIIVIDELDLVVVVTAHSRRAFFANGGRKGFTCFYLRSVDTNKSHVDLFSGSHAFYSTWDLRSLV